jgi:hypothetical protein
VLAPFAPATNEEESVHVSGCDAAPSQYFAESSSSGDALVVLMVATVVLAQSHATAEVWLKVLVNPALLSERLPAAS